LTTAQENLLIVRKQRDSESISDFMSELRKLAATCGFTTSERLNETLLQCLTNIVKDVRIKEKLWSNPQFSLSEAIQCAQAHEAILQQLGASNSTQAKGRSTDSEGNTAEVALVNARYHRHLQRNLHQGQPWTPCWRYGRNHAATSCPVASWVCVVCNRVGHIAHMCLDARATNYSRQRGGGGESHSRGTAVRGARGGTQQIQRGAHTARQRFLRGGAARGNRVYYVSAEQLTRRRKRSYNNKSCQKNMVNYKRYIINNV
jgi:hypothetical protein